MDEKYVASCGKDHQSSDEWVRKVRAQFEADPAQFDAKRSAPSRISVNRREDLGMIEVLYERGSASYTSGMPIWEASY
jgi:hypothetical protein